MLGENETRREEREKAARGAKIAATLARVMEIMKFN